MPAGLLHLFEELCRVYCDREGKQRAAIVGSSPLWAVWPDANAQLVAEAQVRKLKGLRLEKDMHDSLLTSGLAEKVESRMCCFAKLGVYKLPQIQV